MWRLREPGGRGELWGKILTGRICQEEIGKADMTTCAFRKGPKLGTISNYRVYIMSQSFFKRFSSAIAFSLCRNLILATTCFNALQLNLKPHDHPAEIPLNDKFLAKFAKRIE